METRSSQDSLRQQRETLKTELRRRIENGYYLPHSEWCRFLLNRHFSAAPSKMHVELFKFIDGMMQEGRRGTRTIIEGPRGSAKSTLLSLALPLRCAVEGREPYIVIVSAALRESKHILKNIAAEMVGNADLNDVYERVEVETCSTERLKLTNGSVIESFSAGSHIRSHRERENRPTLIIVDDPEGDSEAEFEGTRDRTSDWMNRALFNVGNKDTNILIIGTVIHPECFLRTQARLPGWQVYSYKSVLQWPDHMAIWDGEWRQILASQPEDGSDPMDMALKFYEEHREEMDAGAQVCWPEYESLYDLMLLRATQGNVAFASEKQNEPMTSTSYEFPQEYFEDIVVDAMPKGAEAADTIASWDPAKGVTKDTSGCFGVLTIAIRAIDGLIYIKQYMMKSSVQEQIARIIPLVKYWKARAMVVETNAMQNLAAESLTSGFVKNELFISLTSCENYVKKDIRIRRIEPWLSQRKLRFVDDPETMQGFEQLRQFPVHEHKDGPDSLEMALRHISSAQLSAIVTSGRRRTAGWFDREESIRSMVRAVVE